LPNGQDMQSRLHPEHTDVTKPHSGAFLHHTFNVVFKLFL